VIVILAGRFDWSARTLAAHWARHDVRVLTPLDLSRPGWCHPLEAPQDGVAVVGGRAVSAREISGVLTRISGVSADELTHVVAEDREYVAQEMTAFLRSWLLGLAAMVLNRPTAACLAGPGWSREAWTQAATALGLAVRSLRRRVGLPARLPVEPEPTVETVTVVGERCFGRSAEVQGPMALAVARAAGVSLLSVQFDGPSAEAAFVGADPWPDLADAEIARAVASLLNGRGAQC
jgi:hypothetical protein